MLVAFTNPATVWKLKLAKFSSPLPMFTVPLFSTILSLALVAPVAANAPAGSPCSNLAAGGTTQASVTTGNDGRARVCVLYPQNYNLWVDARIQARASVQGTEFGKSATFELDALADDINDINTSPPGQVSPFGAVDTSPGAIEPACLQPPPG